MMTKQRLPLLTIAMLLLGFVLPAAAAAPPAPAPPKGEKAGSITALLPIARIVRGAGAKAISSDAKKGDDIIWNDLIKTERGGRARITLNDQSILSLGSQADLRVVKHDARNQQTALQMTYGRVRAEVAKVTRQGGSFELRTPTAVAGVIGTDFGTDASSVGSTTFLCISGVVQVSNSDPNIAGSVQCAPGLTTTVSAGKAPTPPENATPEQIQQLIQDTEPAVIAAMSPLSALPGTAVNVTITGTKLAGVKSVSPSGAGLTTTLVGKPADSSVVVHVVVAADAQPGPRMITLAKSSGASSAAMFTILATPTAATGGDLKKPYIDLMTQEGQADRAGLSAYVAGVQQAKDQALQELQQADANANLNGPTNALTGQITLVQNAIDTAGAQIDQAVAQATTAFQTQYNTAYQALLQRHPDGAPDDQFNQSLKAIFDSINGTLGNAFTAIRANLIATVSSANTNIAQLQQAFMGSVTSNNGPAPAPNVNSSERSIDVGAAFGGAGISALDASNSRASGSSSIVSYRWVLCDPSYKPAQFGVLLAGNANAGCNPLSGYQSSNSDFQFQTCNLSSNDYIARVTVTDSNNQSAAMDVKVHVLPTTYDDPATLVRNLAQAYMTLQQNNFLRFFDETGFSGFTALSENVRNTFPLLASMQINPLVSQAAITCNDATVRADWAQNYTYKANPNISFKQSEQLSMRMVRRPGKGWFITDFQGDNGTVQGQLPGPAVTDSAQPDLFAQAVYPTYVGGTSTNPPVPPGAQSFTAVIQNIGGADFTVNTVVRFQLLDSSNTPLGNAVDVPLPTPLTAGSTVNVQATLTVPNTIPVGSVFQVSVNVNPNNLPEARSDNNQVVEALVLGTPVHLTQVTTPTLQVGGFAVALTVNVSAAAPVTLTLPTGITTTDPLTQTTSGAGNVTWNLKAGFTAVAGANQTMTVTANAGIPITLAAIYSVTAPTFTQIVTPTLTAGGPAQALTVNVSAPGTYTLVLPSGITTTSANPQTITSVTGGTLTWNIASSFTAATGTGLFANVTSGIYSFAATYNNTGQANYVITSATFGTSPGPYTGANAMQVNAASTLIVVVKNVGNTSPTGSITVTGTCAPLNPADTTSCVGGGNPTATVAAPAAGQIVVASGPLNFNGILPGSFIGTATLTTAIPQSSTADDTFTLPFDVADFVVTVQNPLDPQYILPGTSQIVTVQVQTFGTTPFAIPVTASGAYTGITYTPASANVNNTTQVFTVTAAAGTPPGAFAATFTGTNRGVTRSATEAFVVISPQIVSTNLFLNDASNPLQIQMGSTTPETVSLKLTGASFNGTATIVPPVSVVGFTVNINPTTSVLANGTFDLTVSASSSATTVVTPLVITVQLPGTNPVLSITYTLFVKAVGLPDLQVLSATPSITFSAAAPWLDGQSVDYTVTIKNNGGVSSAGNESVTLEVNGIPAGSTTLVSPLAPGASQQLTLHAVAPDVHGNTTFSGTGTVKVKVDPDTNGDLNYANNSLTSSVAMANWRFVVNGPGTQQNPAPLTISGTGPWSTGATFQGAVDGAPSYAFSPSMFSAVAGQSSTSISIGNFAAGSPGFFTATVSTSNNLLQNGPYFAQVIVQMLDGATVTAQRQATVWIALTNGTTLTTVAASLTSSANNCTGTGCTSNTGTPLQINGGLAEQFSVTISMICTTGGIAPITAPCPGTADLAIHDAFNTDTTPLGSTNAVPTGTPLVLRVAAAVDPNGNIQTGPASGYAIGINGIQHAAVRQGTVTSPDPVGVQVQMLFNVGDLNVTANTGANSCTGVIANGTPLQLNVSWQALGGFNVPSLSWQWEDGNHSPVGASPLSFSSASGSSTYSGGSYSPSPSFTLTNTLAQDGIKTYFLAVTISNGTSTATKYFPFYFDLSLTQNFCGAVSSARGYNRIQGTWSRSAAGFGGPVSPSSAQLKSGSSGMADVHIAAADVSFTPSMPKVGDAVQVRFRARNAGDADASGIPIALQINGVTVASDTFDVPAGRSVLGGLTWTAVEGMNRPARSSRDSDAAPAALAGVTQLQAMIVVDPQHLTKQKTAQDKSAAIAHFSLRGSGSAGGGGTVLASSQRILIELEDGACVGLRLSSGGTMPCGSADLEITIGDLAKSLLSFESMSGVGDIGTSFETARRTNRSAVHYSAQASGMSGHTYAVQLPNGNTAVVNVESVRNPAELDAAARSLFRASAARILRNLGDSSGAQAPGDLTGGGSHVTVFIVLNVQGM
jgi:hypothetical protein